MTGLVRGVGDLLAGARTIIKTPKLWPYALVPLIINIVVYIAVIGMGIYFFSDIMGYYLPDGEGWYYSLLRYLLWVVLAVVIVIGTFFTFFSVACVISSPFNELLSARYEELLTGQRPDEGLSIVASLAAEIKRLIVYIIAAAILLIITIALSFVPGLNLIIPILWALFSGFVAAFEFLSYPLERKGLSFGQKMVFLKANLSRSEGFGIGIYFALFVPVLNFMVIPAAVIGATSIVVLHDRQSPASFRSENS